MQPLTSLSIDLNALRHNLSEVKRCAPHSHILAMLKADAYGHGLLVCANALDQADGFGVARMEEAIQLRNHLQDQGIDKKIVLLNAVLNHETINYCAEHNIDLVIYDEAGVSALNSVALQKPLNIWLKIDTGMHRLGLQPDTIFQHYQPLKALPYIASITVMTHFSDSELIEKQITDEQLNVFKNACRNIDVMCSLANSAAIIQSPETHADWVRPGIMLYGANPVFHKTTSNVSLRSVMSLHSQILSIRSIAAGESIGYNGLWTASRNSRIATVAIGYGDGYPRHAKNGTPVLINGERFPLVGRVSMDLISVDITDAKNIQLGDEVTLWGYDKEGNELSANEVATYANTVSYHLFTGITARVKRSFKN
jgi:alanine racemase